MERASKRQKNEDQCSLGALYGVLRGRPGCNIQQTRMLLSGKIEAALEAAVKNLASQAQLVNLNYV
jgi:hypothetical protein